MLRIPHTPAQHRGIFLREEFLTYNQKWTQCTVSMFSLAANSPLNQQRKEMNVLLSAQTQLSVLLHMLYSVFVMSQTLSRECKRFLVPQKKIFFQGTGLCQSGRFSIMAVQLCPHVTSHAADTTAKLPAIHVLSFLPWHTVSTHCFVVILLLVCLFPFFFLCKDGVFLPSPVLILLILFLVCFWFFCLDFSWAVAFPAEK